MTKQPANASFGPAPQGDGAPDLFGSSDVEIAFITIVPIFDLTLMRGCKKALAGREHNGADIVDRRE
jgi:hypothetical protein